MAVENRPSTPEQNRQASLGPLLLKGGVFTLIFAAVLFALAGRLDLPMLWAFVGATALMLAVIILAVFRHDPGLVRERQRPGAGTKGWDRIWFLFYEVSFVGAWVLAVLDVGRLHWSDTVPLGLQIVGLLGYMGGLGLFSWGMAVNTFFSKMVRIQEDRGQRVITSGPYQYVRHPGYVGGIVMALGSVLAIGSWWSLVPAGLTTLLIVWRTAMEDKTLQRELPGYVEYTQKVRYRLIPGIW